MVLAFVQFPAMALLGLNTLTKVQHETVVTVDGAVQSWVIPLTRRCLLMSPVLGLVALTSFMSTTAKFAVDSTSYMVDLETRPPKPRPALVSAPATSRRDALRALVGEKRGKSVTTEVTSDVPFSQS